MRGWTACETSLPAGGGSHLSNREDRRYCVPARLHQPLIQKTKALNCLVKSQRLHYRLISSRAVTVWTPDPGRRGRWRHPGSVGRSREPPVRTVGPSRDGHRRDTPFPGGIGTWGYGEPASPIQSTGKELPLRSPICNKPILRCRLSRENPASLV